jgi:hypothetical protein
LTAAVLATDADPVDLETTVVVRVEFRRNGAMGAAKGSKW